MPLTVRMRRLRAALVAAVAVAAATVGAAIGSAATTKPSATVTVSSTAVGTPVPAGFLGMSMETKGLEQYLGDDPNKPDQAFVQLLRNLSPAGGTVVRIGADGSDWSWWPVPGMSTPGGVKYDIGSTWAQMARVLAADLHGRLILGLNFEADSSRLAAYEAAELLSHIGSSYIDAFELGNEPELYGSFPWYKNALGKEVPGRAPGYDFEEFLSDYGRIAGALPSSVPLAGPSSGAVTWLTDLGTFIQHEPKISLLTVHAYPTKHCGSVDITPADLFQSSAIQGLAGQLAGYEQVAAEHHLPLRVDEMNSVSCGGEAGLSNSFAPALWALQLLPDLAEAGISGVNFHTIPTSINSIIKATDTRWGWRVTVQPEYLGLLAFAQAAPAGSRLLKVAQPQLAGLDEWAAQAPSGAIHVVIVNTSTSARTLAVAVAGASSNQSASVTRLIAPSLGATYGVTLGGQTISDSTGSLSGASGASSVSPSGGAYDLTAAAGSATILTIAPRA